MWVTYLFIGYLNLAMAVPLALPLAPLWHKANASRCVKCPRDSKSVSVRLDPWYAVKMHALGDRELLVRDCTEWPGRAGCRQECLAQIPEIA